MKKLMLMLVLPVLVLSCTDTPQQDTQPTPPPTLGTDTDIMLFPHTGQTQTLHITAENLEEWSAYSDISWIELGEPNIEAGTIEVTVAPTEEILDKSGEIIVYSDMEEVARVSVTQTGNGIIYDRPTAELMNFRGPVKEVSFYFNPCYIWEVNSDYMHNLKFDERGRLTDFVFEEHDNVSYHAQNTTRVTYDDNNRPLKMEVTSNAQIAPGEKYQYTLTFEYGNGENYFETNTFMGLLFEGFGIYTAHRMWLPKMLKGLEKLSIESNAITISGFYLDFKDMGNTGTCTAHGLFDTGTVLDQHLYDYQFEGNFTKWVQYLAVFSGLENVLHQQEYYVEPLSGYILSERINIIDAGFIGMEKIYHTNLANSFYRYTEEIAYGYSMDVTYNDLYDVVDVSESYHGIGAYVEYNYDTRNNWTSLQVQAAPNATYPIETKRTITYYE
jgi:hypothetical protein